MTTVSSTTTQPLAASIEPEVRRDKSAGTADFGDLFAHFAQFASRGAARNGSLSLQIGEKTGGGLAQREAQQLRSEQAGDARGRSGLRGRAGKTGREGVGPMSDRQAREAGSRGTQAHNNDRAATEPGTQQSPSGTERTGTAASGAATQRDARTGEGGDARGNGPTNGAGYAHATGSTQAAPGSGPAAKGNAVSALHAVSRAGTTGQQSGGTTLLGGGQQGQSRTSAAAAQPKQKVPTPARDQADAFRAQLAQGLGAALRRGQGRVTLRLSPNSLGELQVRLQVKGSTVDAHIKPSTVEAHRLLEQSVDSLRHSFEARGLRVGRIEIEQPPAGKDGPDSSRYAGDTGDPEGQPEMSAEGDGRLSEDSATDGRAATAGGSGSGDEESVEQAIPLGHGSPGIVYSVADGTARIVMVDALA